MDLSVILFRIFSSKIFSGFFILFVLLFSPAIIAQSDTVICYNARTDTVTGSFSSAFDPTIKFDFTASDHGTQNGFFELPLTKPEDTYNNSGFTDFRPAHQFFPVTNYPARTAVKIFFIRNDSLKQQCSGTLVSRNLVLTAAHCLCDGDSVLYHNVFRKELYISPAYDNGQELFSGSYGSKYYLPKEAFRLSLIKDIALIELDKPLGDKMGWIGIAFSSEDKFFNNNIFHKFSYPGIIDPLDSTRIYNGYTLYYNYGTLDYITDKQLGYDIFGIPGQSGSSLFYTNNVDYYSFGVQNWAIHSAHIRINNKIFYPFSEIISKVTADLEDESLIPSEYYLYNAYPNPFNPSTRISFSIPKDTHVVLKIFNLLGEELTILIDEYLQAGTHTVKFDGTTLTSGIYIYAIKAGEFSNTGKAILLK